MLLLMGANGPQQCLMAFWRKNAPVVSQTRKSFGMHSYEKRARKPFGIRSYKSIGLKAGLCP